MMVPLALDLAMLPVALAGGGKPLLKRLTLLDGEAVPYLAVYAPDADLDLVAAAGPRLIPRLPTDNEIASYRVLFVAGLDNDRAEELAARARAHRVLVNVEDVLPFCDFHVPAILRRGDLAISISTGGASPTLSRRLKSWLGQVLPDVWAARTARVASLRQSLRAQGAGPAEVMAATDALIEAEGWLPRP
jgi:precorrin-2 dehydrogenase/sirohydrochlorin ferrochelatase